MSEMQKLDDQMLEDVNGGYGGPIKLKWRKVRCKVQTGYLALRTLPKYDDSNIIGQITNGTVFEVTDEKNSGDYIWAKYSGVTGWGGQRGTPLCPLFAVIQLWPLRECRGCVRCNFLSAVGIVIASTEIRQIAGSFLTVGTQTKAEMV